jgi:uncharacterized protein (DUF488 family)
VKLFTIGFTKSSAESFFSRVQKSGAKSLLDVRLNNVSQLAGFAKRDDLRYFLQEICHIPYRHEPKLAPTQQMLDEYKKNRGSWEDYERKFLNLMAERRIEEINRTAIEDSCLLCSEDKPHHCHRRLVAEYLREKWGGIEIIHL